MNKNQTLFTRRKMLKGLTAGVAGSVAVSTALHSIPSITPTDFLSIPKGRAPESLAKDESFWVKIALFYDNPKNIVNLEQGFWGKMSRPVIKTFSEKTQMVNTQLSYYARKHYKDDHQLSSNKVASALGAQDNELVLTRNATESIHNLIRQYNRLEPKNEILYTDIDYPSFKSTMRWLADSNKLNAVEVILPAQANQQQILDLYIQTFNKHPNLKLMLLTHVSNQHGLILPVADISKEAKQRGIDVICDCAQSWGLLDYKITDLNVDWAGFNLHKWIGSPVGVGALYMREGTLEKISPYPGESDPTHTNANARVHTATTNFASVLTIPAALEFHQMIGAANKEARLRYLRSLWTTKARQMPHIEVLGGIDEESSTGMGAFRLEGKESTEDAKALQQILENKFGVFTVVRIGLASGSCIRITPQVFTSADDIMQLVSAMENLA